MAAARSWTAVSSDIQHLASSIEAQLVKSLHPIDEVAASVALADDHRVRLTRVRDATKVSSPGDDPSHDPAAAVMRALAAPVEFPALAAGTVPGDRVAIALDDAVPCVAEIVRGAVESLRQAGIDADAISVVTTSAETGRICREGLEHTKSPLPQFVVHDPDNNDNLCLVGVTKRGAPLLVNRTIFDADIVLPVSCARLIGGGAYDSLFPRFSDAESIRRHRTPANIPSPDNTAEKMHEADEAGWLIGALMTVQVVPGPGETVAHVVAGEPQTVARRCEALCRARWLLHSPRQVDLVIATITGGSPVQTWTNVGRALATAETMLTDAGAVAVCTNLDEPPGESLGRLIGSNDLEKTERRIGHDQCEDSWAAWQLVRALQRGPVYLLSQLAADTVEDMGLAPIAELAELSRLAARHESFALIEDSQHAVVRIDGDEGA